MERGWGFLFDQSHGARNRAAAALQFAEVEAAAGGEAVLVQPVPGGPILARSLELVHQIGEIGRASCRERVSDTV